ncbi:MAG: alpha/beta hydrolase [Actinobacteria bacterium]|nr:alpha/beta hydrolase [Actinomycetota bacterium]
MDNLRKYGDKPFNVAVVHGGPGVSGEMAPVARELCINSGVLEPLQTAISLGGQVEELKAVIENHGDVPVTLIGHSWGVWLIFILASQNTSLVKKLILVGSGPFEEKYAINIMETRLNRLDEKDRSEAQVLMKNLKDSAIEDKNVVMTRLGKLISKADSYYPLPDDSEPLECQYQIYQNVWQEADGLRRSGKLLKLGEKIQCPVIAVHGDYDPHPFEGINIPLSQIIKDFRFILLKNCGHKPWIERSAKDRFYEVLKEELGYSHL